MSISNEDKFLLSKTTDIVCVITSHNPIIKNEDVKELISLIHESLRELLNKSNAPKNKPAVAIKDSITDEYIICLEDGNKFKSLKRHLRTKYNLSPEQYREKWGLPTDYPMVAKNYSKARSRLAKKMGLGQQTNPTQKKQTKIKSRSNGGSAPQAHL